MGEDSWSRGMHTMGRSRAVIAARNSIRKYSSGDAPPHANKKRPTPTQTTVCIEVSVIAHFNADHVGG
jgi:hypothetical protein